MTPYGVGVPPDNSSGNFDFGWLGQHQRPLEHAPGVTPTIEMGARPYVPSVGRFLEADPVEGGSANDYGYTSGDPVNGRDLGGTRQTVPDPALYDQCVNLNVPAADYDAVVFSPTCDKVRGMVFANKYGLPTDYPPRQPDFAETYLAPGAKVTSYVTGGAAIFVAFIPGAQPVAAGLGATAAVTDVISEVASPEPCPEERIATSIAFSALGAAGGAGLDAAGQQIAGRAFEGTTFVGGVLTHPQC